MTVSSISSPKEFRKGFCLAFILSMSLDYILHFTALCCVTAQFQMVYTFGYTLHAEKLDFSNYLSYV